MKQSLKRKILVVLFTTILLAIVIFLAEYVFLDSGNVVTRNGYGEGKKTENYDLQIEGENTKEQVEIVVEEQEYTKEEIRDMFEQILGRMDKLVLGENESFDRVESNLNLMTGIEDYPVFIEWELDSYSVLNLYGEIQEKNLTDQGTLVELRATISYGDEQVIYMRHARVFPPERTGTDKILYDIRQRIIADEESSRQDKSFTLPTEVDGKELKWKTKKQNNWCYILLVGTVLCIYLVYREREKVRREKKRRREELLRDYPGLISKFTMLLGTGTTVKNAWEKIVQNYEFQKTHLGSRILYEEMAATSREMQSGISEAEAYERFGKRCGTTVYMKFGTLLSQNLRKGSKGISDMLRMEAIQSFENRKSTAKKLGEEAGTKLLAPMLGMLAVVFIMVMVPAFLSMQL